MEEFREFSRNVTWLLRSTEAMFYLHLNMPSDWNLKWLEKQLLIRMEHQQRLNELYSQNEGWLIVTAGGGVNEIVEFESICSTTAHGLTVHLSAMIIARLHGGILDATRSGLDRLDSNIHSLHLGGGGYSRVFSLLKREAALIAEKQPKDTTGDLENVSVDRLVTIAEICKRVSLERKSMTPYTNSWGDPEVPGAGTRASLYRLSSIIGILNAQFPFVQNWD